jgi:hypothetical protein
MVISPMKIYKGIFIRILVSIMLKGGEKRDDEEVKDKIK